MPIDPLHPLEQALQIWMTGQPISLTLAARLMGLGYDVETLEAKHMK